jgi:hypothetical protein
MRVLRTVAVRLSTLAVILLPALLIGGVGCSRSTEERASQPVASAGGDSFSAQAQVQSVNQAMAPEAKITAEDAALLKQEALVQPEEEESLSQFVQ